MPRSTHNRRLRRLRGLLALLAVATALFVAAATRLESGARGIAAVGALGCVIAWLVVLEAEGRIAERLERRGLRRRGARGRVAQRSAARRAPSRRAA
ncbi:hypothetical protein [Lysobacter sp. N42]|jgi:hypothetical protein|uniref:hypothetical protein n=1 Tax=Lysobacter sp. N42 TaxID=2545719 RepID=UPI00104D4698|nr:hypothetical protein [Lysobacter sp. N42]TCZ88086.1 hypothetical protein EYQ95_14645 [Lysobacter sp. N42]